MNPCPKCGAEHPDVISERLRSWPVKTIARVQCSSCGYKVAGRATYQGMAEAAHQRMAEFFAIENWRLETTRFTWEPVDTPGCEGTINLFIGHRCIGLITNPKVVETITANYKKRGTGA